MYDLSRHPYFEPYVDPASGVTSYILKEKVAKLQYNLYFNELGGITYDEKYMWFRCVDWPSDSTCLAVVSLNPDEPFIRTFPCTYQNRDVPFTIIPNTHDALFTVGPVVYRIDIDGNVSKVLEIDNEFINFRRIDRISTHLSFNAAKELILLDMRIGGKSYIATGNFKTGEIKHIHKFMRHYNHAQFSPTDPDIFLLDEDWERDPITGERFDVDKRMWIMDIHGTRLEPIDPDNWFRHNRSLYCHDFWSQDGWLCWPDLLENVYEYNIYTGEKNVVWNREICHAHTLERKFWVGDASPYRWGKAPCRVIFFDRTSGKEIDIFSALPRPAILRAAYIPGAYHNDPHPSFSPTGKQIVSMTTIKNGEIDVAITPVEPLLRLCQEKGNQINEPWQA